MHAEGIRASLRGCGFCSQAVASPGSHQTRVTNAALLCHQCKPQSDSAKRFQAEEGSWGKDSAPVRWEEGVQVSTAWRDDYDAITDFETARRKAMGRYKKKKTI